MADSRVRTPAVIVFGVRLDIAALFFKQFVDMFCKVGHRAYVV